MGSHYRREVHQFRRRAHCPLISQHWNRRLDSVLAGAPTVKSEYADKAEMPVDRHILSWWTVRFPSVSGDGLLKVLSVCVASVIRVPYIAHISLVDPSWSDIDGVIWSVVELNLGIVSACLPTLRLLVIHVFHGGCIARPNVHLPGRKLRMSTEDELLDPVSMTELPDTNSIVVLKASKRISLCAIMRSLISSDEHQGT